MAKKIDIIGQFQKDLTGLGSVAIYNSIKKTIDKFIPAETAYKELISGAISYLLIVYKGKDFIPTSAYDAVRIESIGDLFQGLTKVIPVLSNFSNMINPLIEGSDDIYIEGSDDIYYIEGIDEQGDFSIEGNNDNYVESF